MLTNTAAMTIERETSYSSFFNNAEGLKAINFSSKKSSATSSVVMAVFQVPSKSGTSEISVINALARYRRELLNYSTLTENWDGYGAEPIPETTIQNAFQFLKTLPPYVMPSRIAPSGDGEINIIWDSQETYADFGINNDGTYSFFLESGENKIYGDDIPVETPLSAEVLELLN